MMDSYHTLSKLYDVYEIASHEAIVLYIATSINNKYVSNTSLSLRFIDTYILL